ncbi:hypothetical protein LINGRAHAP2_LOCUS20367 [Linum grandiflorum]
MELEKLPKITGKSFRWGTNVRFAWTRSRRSKRLPCLEFWLQDLDLLMSMTLEMTEGGSCYLLAFDDREYPRE